MPEMVDEINAALTDELDGGLTEGIEPLQSFLSHDRLYSNSIIRQGRESGGEGFQSCLLGFTYLFAHSWRLLTGGHDPKFLERTIKHSTSVAKVGLILPFVPRSLKR